MKDPTFNNSMIGLRLWAWKGAECRGAFVLENHDGEQVYVRSLLTGDKRLFRFNTTFFSIIPEGADMEAPPAWRAEDMIMIYGQ